MDIVKSLTAHTLEIVSCFSYSLLRSHDCCPFLYLSADPDGNADDHGGDSDAGDEGDPHGSPHQGAQLPQDLLLPAPRFLTPERAAGGTVEGERERTGIHLPPYQKPHRIMLNPLTNRAFITLYYNFLSWCKVLPSTPKAIIYT